MRLNEAERLGFSCAVLPGGSREGIGSTLKLDEVTTLADVVAAIAAESAANGLGRPSR
jgi:predicted ATP-dependent serine protease